MDADLVPVTAAELLPARPPRPEEFDEELRARLAVLDDASDMEAAARRPKNTQRSYAGDWRCWERFCAGMGIPVTAATRGTLRAFVKWRWEVEGRAYATVDRNLAGIVVTLRGPQYRVVVDPAATQAARELLGDYRREAAERKEKPRGRGKAPALRVEPLRRIVEACPDTPRGRQEKAAVLVAFSIAARSHELAGLTVRAMEEVEEGLRVDVRVSKTHPRVVPVPYGLNPATCPVRAWQVWRDTAREMGRLLDPEEPAFRQIHRSGSILGALAAPSCAAIITRAGARAGVPVRFTGHSARSGLVTTAARSGKDRKAIAEISGHRPGSPVLEGYIQLAGEFSDDNALFGLGL
ncbi:tyrosine-type recombinase/integrase [Streptacidiphilus sp. ASG 303]|uniref:tyrosine-type recombinase/integrase n=1 Tax=Streptacidiphilus sp. ASG 303 TaxID=2896847 RepID=UPI001E2BDCDA|nr:tyrosine-type recombinase/integrase [Streptacidiphilus sp. ASG 303]MCD0486094.1 tyrosine-type recombinase/integrase [Streptacidiphilus sp. ASG 303]